jgi:hypothetical protein
MQAGNETSNTPIANNYLREECQKDYLHIARGVVPEANPLLRTANCERSFARRLIFLLQEVIAQILTPYNE